MLFHRVKLLLFFVKTLFQMDFMKFIWLKSIRFRKLISKTFTHIFNFSKVPLRGSICINFSWEKCGIFLLEAYIRAFID
jgi:hypothetical protein